MAGQRGVWDGRFFEQNHLFWPIRHVAASFADSPSFPSIAFLQENLGPLAGVEFRLQPPRPRKGRRKGTIDPGSMYDARITEGWVPTRADNLHDFFNALVWAAFPKAKRAFHERQHKVMEARLSELGPRLRALPNARTREQDGLAMLDEGSILLLACSPEAPTVSAALEARDVQAVHRAIAVGHAVALVFGHALYESLLSPQAPPIWGMTALLPCPASLPTSEEALIELADRRLAEEIAVTGSYSHPEAFRSLPLQEHVLCRGT